MRYFSISPTANCQIHIPESRTASRLACWPAGWLAGRLARRPAGQLASQPPGQLLQISTFQSKAIGKSGVKRASQEVKITDTYNSQHAKDDREALEREEHQKTSHRRSGWFRVSSGAR